jgi:hypothetical protein
VPASTMLDVLQTMMLWNSVPPAALELVAVDVVRLLSEPRFSSIPSLDVAKLWERLNFRDISVLATGLGPSPSTHLPSLSAALASAAKTSDSTTAVVDVRGNLEMQGHLLSGPSDSPSSEDDALYVVFHRTLARQGSASTLAIVLSELVPLLTTTSPSTPRARDLAVSLIIAHSPFNSSSFCGPPPLLEELVLRYLPDAVFSLARPRVSASAAPIVVSPVRMRALGHIVGLALLRAPQEDRDDDDEGVAGATAEVDSLAASLANQLAAVAVKMPSSTTKEDKKTKKKKEKKALTGIGAVSQFVQALASVEGLGERWPELVITGSSGAAVLEPMSTE